MYFKCVKFHKNPISRLGGVALTRYMDGRQTDGRTDRVIPIYPPNFVCGGYNNGRRYILGLLQEKIPGRVRMPLIFFYLGGGE
jgi:hypothetical protein